LLNVFSRREIDCTVKRHLLSVKPAMAILKSGSCAIGCAQVLAVSAVTVIESLLKTLAIARTARAVKLTAGRSSDEFALELHYARAAGAKVSRYRCCASVMLRASIQSGQEKQCLPRELPFACHREQRPLPRMRLLPFVPPDPIFHGNAKRFGATNVWICLQFSEGARSQLDCRYISEPISQCETSNARAKA
jgi:hypothetical protein